MNHCMYILQVIGSSESRHAKDTNLISRLHRYSADNLKSKPIYSYWQAAPAGQKTVYLMVLDTIVQAGKRKPDFYKL